MRLADQLADAHVVLTGVTGFVGEALLHRLLTDFPQTRVTVLVRPRRGQDATERVARLLDKPVFGPVAAVARAKLADGRLGVVSSDLTASPTLPADTTVVIHCAGDVSFDAPIDVAFDTNVVGTRNMLEAVLAVPTRPHYVHVSTAYVSGQRRGAVLEAPVEHSVGWQDELAAAARVRERVEDESRSLTVLTELRAQAEHEHGPAGPLTAAADAEQRRRGWVHQRLVGAGRERARSLGWTDVYTFTKAMAERCVEELGRPLPVSFVRPSIIESARAVPHPGWIEGFKMAEPIILAYGRGELPEFSAAPDAVCDIVPVDHVVGALLATAAHPPEPGQPTYLHVASGARNPLTYHRLYSLVREYFTAHPLPQPDRGPARLPVWRWPGGDAVDRLLTAGDRAHRVAESVVTRLPRSGRTRETVRRLDRQQRRLAFLRRYHELYRAYVESELCFVDDRALALLERLDPADRVAFGFDPAAVDWDTYIRDVHCPSITAGLRTHRPRTARSRGGPPPITPARDVVAVFDMDGTIIRSNVIEAYLWLRLTDSGLPAAAREVGTLLAQLPRYLVAERRDRAGFLRAAHRRYAGARLVDLDRLVDEEIGEYVLAAVTPAALRRVRAHRSAGHRTVLVTGAVRPLTRPLTPLFDDVVAADLAVDARGRCTGFLTAPPLVGESRAGWLARHAREHGLDLAASYAYGDSHSDAPLLRAVGHPVAVNPDVALARIARRHRWPVEEWPVPAGRSRLTAVLERVR